MAAERGPPSSQCFRSLALGSILFFLHLGLVKPNMTTILSYSKAETVKGDLGYKGVSEKEDPTSSVHSVDDSDVDPKLEAKVVRKIDRVVLIVFFFISMFREW